MRNKLYKRMIIYATFIIILLGVIYKFYPRTFKQITPTNDNVTKVVINGEIAVYDKNKTGAYDLKPITSIEINDNKQIDKIMETFDTTSYISIPHFKRSASKIDIHLFLETDKRKYTHYIAIYNNGYIYSEDRGYYKNTNSSKLFNAVYEYLKENYKDIP